MSEIANNINVLSEKQSEYMQLIAEIMEIRKRGEKPLAYIQNIRLSAKCG